MKAIRIREFGGPEVLQVEEVPDPRPAPGQVVVRVKAVGVNPVEAYIRSGNYGKRDFPFTPEAGGRAGCASCAGSSLAGLPATATFILNGKPRRGCDSGNAGERKPGEGPDGAGETRAGCGDWKPWKN